MGVWRTNFLGTENSKCKVPKALTSMKGISNVPRWSGWRGTVVGCETGVVVAGSDSIGPCKDFLLLWESKTLLLLSRGITHLSWTTKTVGVQDGRL